MKRQGIIVTGIRDAEGTLTGWLTEHPATGYRSGNHRTRAQAMRDGERYLVENGLKKQREIPKESENAPKGLLRGYLEAVKVFKEDPKSHSSRVLVGKRRTRLVEAFGEPLLTPVLEELEQLAL